MRERGARHLVRFSEYSTQSCQNTLIANLQPSSPSHETVLTWEEGKKMQWKGVEGIKNRSCGWLCMCVCVCPGLCNHLNVNATLIELLLRPFLFSARPCCCCYWMVDEFICCFPFDNVITIHNCGQTVPHAHTQTRTKRHQCQKSRSGARILSKAARKRRGVARHHRSSSFSRLFVLGVFFCWFFALFHSLLRFFYSMLSLPMG